MTSHAASLLLCTLPLLCPILAAASPPTPLPVKVVVITTFEVGKDSGDVAGEFQEWYEREHLTTRYPLPAGYHDAFANDAGVLAFVTGEGTAHAAASVMALGNDPRFDFSKTYWLLAGIAGGDPADASLGSAAWAEWIVDGDLAHEIDAREMPADWPSPFIPLDASAPYPKEHIHPTLYDVVFHLNGDLRNWAYELTKDTPLVDNERMKANRARYIDNPAAQRPPFVLKGDNLASSTFWHGKLMNKWANDWVKYWTDGKGNYVTTAKEDTGAMQSLSMLAKAGRVDFGRVMDLRTVSNYDSQPPGMTAAQSLQQENAGEYSAFGPAIEADYRVGSRVVHELIEHWDKYGSTPPR
jgi:purine nucleoside permease